ncbi:hypothetical protein MKK55_07485 [Methylobacterium sp. J-059]|uniref:hypothetical protein n=1 Tax=Methylobacterium sp. J-059 TaxID=2836643 RepID=UPI001FBA0EEA|nr:hypothetical protein [Methylobacterium sp. J-059]MCJ2038797.1 hypothetical protein [Methylobacterium sp. J-059]
MSNITPIMHAVKRFRRDAEQAGGRVVAWPTIDPTFRVSKLEHEGDHVLLYGTDDRGRDAMLIIPAPQFGLCMIFESGQPERGSFGFVHHKGDGA